MLNAEPFSKCAYGARTSPPKPLISSNAAVKITLPSQALYASIARDGPTGEMPENVAYPRVWRRQNAAQTCNVLVSLAINS